MQYDYGKLLEKRLGLLRCEWQCLTFHSHGNFNLNFSIPPPPISIPLTHRCSVCHRETFERRPDARGFTVTSRLRWLVSASSPFIDDRNSMSRVPSTLIANPRRLRGAGSTSGCSPGTLDGFWTTRVARKKWS